MAFFDEQTIEQVQQASDIVSVIQEYVQLKRAGRNFKACCPFHKEKTPSFIVSPDRQTYHCFGCSIGGDVFDFLMRIDGLNFVEALRHLAGKAGIDLPEASPGEAQSTSRREKLLQIYELAVRFFRAHYSDDVQGKPAREYMASRQFDPKILEEFGVGFAPPSQRKLFEGLRKKGVPEEDVLASGLVTRSQYGNVIDLFRGRVMFPIANAQGKIVGFGGRVMNDELPKYINSPESDIFKKRRELYALHRAKRYVDRDDPFLIVVEGYLDVMRLHAAGVRNAVGTLGTALTEEHARILKRYVKEIVLVFDGDRAGEDAALRGLEVFLVEGMSVKVVAMPAGFDPDDFVRDRGGEEFKRLVQAGEDIFSFKLKLLMKRHNHREARGLMTITTEMVSTLAMIPNAVLVDRYVKQLSVVLGVDEQSIQLELAKVHDKLSARFKANEPEEETPSTPLSKNPFQAEYAIISLIAEDEALAHQARDVLSGNDFLSREVAEVFDRIQARLAENQSVSARAVLHWDISPALKSYLSAHLYAHLSLEEKNRALEHCIQQLKQKLRQDRASEIRRKIREAEMKGDHDQVAALVREFQELTRLQHR
ncbi:MAG: DNA primase [Candidatus Omnitrophica bacterium]|nr:DNA primase [Candidatus Omnitrophota bacterium]